MSLNTNRENKEKINPKKSLGQNFLINSGILKKIVEAGKVTKSDLILEVGPGTGNLTELLSLAAKRIIAVEKDHRLVPELQKKFKGSNVKIVEDDILKFIPSDYNLAHGTYKLIGNIPYYITSHFIRKVFQEWPQPELIVLTIQKEVAQRILAKPGDMNILALAVQYYSEPKIISYVSAGSFRPVPKVDSAIINLQPRQETRGVKEEARFFEVIHAGFHGKRKILISNISKNLGIEKEFIEVCFSDLGIDKKTRAEDLSLDSWISLSNTLSKM